MGSINKKILLPLLSAIALFVKQAFGYEIPGEWLNVAADVILYIIMLIGIFIKPKTEKEVEPDVKTEAPSEFAGLDEEHKASV